MKVLAPLLTLALLLEAGCALGPRHYWYHPERTLEEAKADYRQCKQWAQQEAGEAVADEHLVDIRSKSRASGDESFGVDRMETSSSLGAMYRENALSGCMQSRGYLRVKDYRLPSDVRRKSYTPDGVAGW
jgi:hypothetical protein